MKNFFKGLSKGQKITFVGVIVPFLAIICATLMGILNWFGVPYGEIIIDKYFSTKTPIIINSTPTLTSSITPLSIFTIESTPTQQEEPGTIPSNEIFSYQFRDLCISTTWQTFPMTNQKDHCMDPATTNKFNLIALENGLDFIVDKSEIGTYKAIFIKIPEEYRELSFDLFIDELYAQDPISQFAVFFWGFMDKEPEDSLDGNFAVLKTSNPGQVSLSYEKNPIYSKNLKYYNVEMDKKYSVTIDLNQFNLSFIGEQQFYEFKNLNLSYQSKYFVIGYFVPANGQLVSSIHNFMLK